MSGRRDQLAARRAALGMTQESLAEALGASAASVRRWELGTSKPHAPKRPLLADLLQVTLPELERMFSGEPPAALNGQTIPAYLRHYSSLERGAARLQMVEPIILPGLLQTEDYAAATMCQNHYQPVSEETVAERVRIRMERQVVLDREPEPLELHCVIDESVLNRQVGSAEVMADQMDHLLSVATKPTVMIQIIPANGGALFSTWFGAFTLFTSTGSSTPFTACTEDLGGVHYQDSPPIVEAHADLFAHLAAVALTPEQSADLIRNQAESYR